MYITHAAGLAALSTLALAACEDQNRLTFATSAEIGIGVDPALQTANVGYNRQELVIAPQAEDASVSPTYASIEKNRDLLNPQIKQLFAVGDAAVVIVGGAPGQRTVIVPPGNRGRPLVFGTSTNLGLKISSSQSPLPEFNFGYKRKEYSSLRVGAANRTGSLFGSLRVSTGKRSGAQTDLDPNFEVKQIIATGAAATAAAREIRPDVVEEIEKEVKRPLCEQGLVVGDDEESCVAAQPAAVPAATP